MDAELQNFKQEQTTLTEQDAKLKKQATGAVFFVFFLFIFPSITNY